MTDSQKALAILTKVRNRYVERITEFVLANEQEMQERAEGNGYFNSDELFDMSEQLRQLAIILAHYPIETTTESVQFVAAEPISFALWAEQIRSGNLDGAAVSLSYLFQIDLPAAAWCTRTFAHKLQFDPKVLAKVQRLRTERNLNQTLFLLYECFGLHGDYATHVASILLR